MNDIKYENLILRESEDGDELTVVDCDKSALEVSIPEYVDGKPVTAIGEFAFEDCTELVKVSFPDYGDDFFINGYSFKEIGDYAFSGCISLQSIDLPHSVGYIGRSAFVDCVSLSEVKSYGEIHIAPYAFYRCKNLKRVPTPAYISEGIFGYCESLTDFPVAEGMESIDEDAFEHCDSLTRIVIPKSVKRIEQLAFRGCKNLSEVVFSAPDGWRVRIRYGNNTEYELDLNDSAKNAVMLSRMDFDDGVVCWYKET